MTELLTNLKVNSDELPKKVLVCGDPSRAEKIASLLDDSKLLAKNREYHSYKGSWQGVELAIVSHGVGSPGAAVCFEELAKGGAKTIIRIGTAGSYQAEIQPGHIVISTAAVRRDGLTSQLVPEGFPAVADRQVVGQLVDAANARNQQIHEGITLTLDVFYSGIIEFPHELYKRAGVLAVEMENSALFTIGAIRGVNTGAILAIDGYADADLRNEYNPHTNVVSEAIEQEAFIALDAIIHT